LSAPRIHSPPLVQKARHLRGDTPETRGATDDDRIVQGKVFDAGDVGRLVEFEVGALCHLGRNSFRYPLHVNGGAGGTRAFGHRGGERLNVAVGRVVQH
jgi:hypothetical protein